MSANVALSDTFDQWRVKTNEILVATQTDGSDNFIKLNNTTNSTSNTTGSIISAGGIGIAKSAVVGGNLTVHGNVDVDGTFNFDASDIDGAWQIDGTVTVGVDDTGYDVKFFGATSGAYMLWDESTDDLVLAGAAKLYLYDAGGGEYISSSGSALTISSGSGFITGLIAAIAVPPQIALPEASRYDCF